MAGAGGGPLAAATQPAPRVAPAWQAGRSPGDDEGVARDRLGDAAGGAHPQPRAPPPGGPRVRRQSIDATVRHHLSASPASTGPAAEWNPPHALPLLAPPP